MFGKLPTAAQRQIVQLQTMLAERDVALNNAAEALQAMQLLQENRAALISIETTQAGRAIRFGFVRNGELTYVETYRDFSVDIDALKKKLLEK